MASRTTSITAMAVDSPITQSATRGNMDAADRRYLDDQILGVQRHLVDSLVSGVLCTWAIVDGSSPTLATGDAVVLSGVGTQFAGQSDVGGVGHEIPKVTLATTSALTNAGGRLYGIVVAGASPGANVKVAVAGLLPPSITGVTATSGFAYVNQTTGRITTASSLAQGDVVVGSVGLGSVVTAGFDYARSFATKTVLQSATGDEAALSLGYTVNKATSGDDSGLKISITDTSSPGTSRWIDLWKDGVRCVGIIANSGTANSSMAFAGSGAVTAAGSMSLLCGISQVVALESPGGLGLYVGPSTYVHYYNGQVVRTDTHHNTSACSHVWASTVTSVTYKIADSAAATAGRQIIFQAGAAGSTGTRSAGGDINVLAGNAGGNSGSGAKGGSGFFSAGSGSTSDGAGGDLSFTGGSGGTTNGNGGDCQLNGGGPSGTGRTGAGAYLKTGGLIHEPVTITYGATTVVDLSKGSLQKVTLTGNITTFTLNNMRAGGIYHLVFVQDGTGSRTLALPATMKPTGGTLTLSTGANKTDTWTAWSDGTSLYEICRGMNC